MSVVAFHGKSHVGVLQADGGYDIRLARIGAKTATTLCTFSTAEDAVREARIIAQDSGWKFIGLFDEHRIREIEKWSGDGQARWQDDADGAGPDAA